MSDEELLHYATTGEAAECASALVVELVNRMERLIDEIDGINGGVADIQEFLRGEDS
jgi:hypothetical protein